MRFVMGRVMACIMALLLVVGMTPPALATGGGDLEQSIEQASIPRYEVSSEADLKDAIEMIESDACERAEIALIDSIGLSGSEFGAVGSTIVLDSVGDSPKTITSNDEAGLYLVGNVVFKNVKIGSKSLFAQGHTVEFAEGYQGSGLRLYGGSDKDLNLIENGDEDGSTHIIIRSGKFHSIVGGNKDTFDQGKYHEYADWSNVQTNKHTVLTGDVKIDVYGGSWGGSYNIDVGDTCCNTNVTPTALYGGGLGSDTVGDVSVNVYGMDATSGYNDKIFGGGLGIAGGEDDATVTNDAVKHTGVVYGNVSLGFYGGRVAEFYGGGYHGGSAFKPSLNVTGERFNQAKYHRDKVAVVTGDVNVVMGGDMVLCQNTSSAWGGSYASTIGGDLNVTIKDGAKLAAKYALNNGGAPTPNTMNDLVNTYAQYYDQMYGGSGWENRFVITGEYDIIEGDANLSIEGGYAWEIHGTSERMWGSGLDGVKSTEVRGAMNIEVSGGMVHDLWGDYYGESTINGGINVDMTGGEVFSLNAYDGRNDSLPSGSRVDVMLDGGTVYALAGSYKTLPESVTSSLIMDSESESEDGVLNVGYVEGFDAIEVSQGSDVWVDAIEVIRNKFMMPSGSYEEDRDSAFYRNVVNLDISSGATLTTCAAGSEISGSLRNDGGTWIANGVTVIGGNSGCAGGKIFFKEPSTIVGNASWGDTLLCLPVVEPGSNYDGVSSSDIALTVEGLSTGSANVRTVQREDHEIASVPCVGDNYVLSAKNGDSPAQEVYRLENEEALKAGLYLCRTDDPKDASGTYMWQVAQGELPKETLLVYPEDQTIYVGGESGSASNPEFPVPVFLSEDEEGALAGIDGISFCIDGAPYSGLPFEVRYYEASDSGSLTEVLDDARYGDYVAKAVPKQDVQNREITTSDGRVVNFGEGTLRIRYVSDFGVAEENELTHSAFWFDGEEGKPESMAEAEARALEEGDEAAVLLREETEVFLNGDRRYQYPEGSFEGISLMFDKLLPEKGGDNESREKALTEHAVAEGFEVEGKESSFRYLDLVDANNSNAWVSSSDGSDVFWAYPEGVDAETDITLLHFKGLHREYAMGENGTIAEEISESEVEKVEPFARTSAGIWFHVPESGFSPFALFWDDSGSGGTVVPPDPTSTVTLTYEENGGKPLPDEEYEKGSMASLRVPLREGYTFEGWYLDEGLTVPASDPLLMDRDRTVWAKWEITGIPDDLIEEHVNYIIGRNLPQGWMIEPESPITRAEVAAIFFRLLEEDVRAANYSTNPSFPDAVPGAWYSSSVATLEKMGIIKGDGNGLLRPDDPITRGELAAIAARFDEIAWSGKTIFSDLEGHWAEEVVSFGAERGWIMGYDDGTFRPDAFITRAETMAVVNRVLQRLPESEEDLLPGRNQWPDNVDKSAWYWLVVEEATNAHDHETKEDGISERWTERLEDVDWHSYDGGDF